MIFWGEEYYSPPSSPLTRETTRRPYPSNSLQQTTIHIEVLPNRAMMMGIIPSRKKSWMLCQNRNLLGSHTNNHNSLTADGVFQFSWQILGMSERSATLLVHMAEPEHL